MTSPPLRSTGLFGIRHCRRRTVQNGFGLAQIRDTTLCPLPQCEMRVMTPRAALQGRLRTLLTTCGMTLRTIFLAKTSDPLALCRSLPSAREFSFESSDQNTFYSATSANTTWNWHKTSETPQVSLPLCSWQRQSNMDILQHHVSCRPQRTGRGRTMWLALRLPHATGPYPSDACQPSPPLHVEPPRPRPGLPGSNGAGSSTASSTGRLALKQSMEDFFSSFGCK